MRKRIRKMPRGARAGGPGHLEDTANDPGHMEDVGMPGGMQGLINPLQKLRQELSSMDRKIGRQISNIKRRR
ncbi:MAG: hypothetical protein HQ564_10065 [Candidatus Saganbacteria bacterium]|nr:hypothetical protein [Candidatus Saganbacteria bacterium]